MYIKSTAGWVNLHPSKKYLKFKCKLSCETSRCRIINMIQAMNRRIHSKQQQFPQCKNMLHKFIPDGLISTSLCPGDIRIQT